MALWQRLVLGWWYRGGWGGLCLCGIRSVQRSWVWDLCRVILRHPGKLKPNVNWVKTIWNVFLLLVFWFLWVIAVWNETWFIMDRKCEQKWHGKKSHQLFSLGLPRPPSRSHLLSGLWLSSMKIFSRSQHMCRHQRPTTAWNSRGQFIKGDVAIGSLFFLACAQAERLSLKFCFLTSIFIPQEYFCLCLVGQLTSNQTSSTLFIRLFCMPVLQILDIPLQAMMFLWPDIFTSSAGKFSDLRG